MGKKCPPGVLCIENATLLFIICTGLTIALYYYYNKSLHLSSTNIQNIDNNVYPPQQSRYNVEFVQSKDIFTNPYMPPLKHNFFVPPTTGDPRGVPINIPTRGFISEYKQVGLLNRVNGKETVLPLLGRPLYSNRQKWQYYTMREYNNIKLPVSKNGNSCTSEYGCDELFNGDTIYVEGYKDAFKITLYEIESPRYIPYL
mgnify:FL=1|jgi:hypothetical protein